MIELNVKVLVDDAVLVDTPVKLPWWMPFTVARGVIRTLAKNAANAVGATKVDVVITWKESVSA